MSSSLGGLEPGARLEQKAATFPVKQLLHFPPRAMPPMSHPVIPPWPNIAPKANEGAALCGGAREGPGEGTRQPSRQPTPGPFSPERSRPERHGPGPPSHKRRGTRGERVWPTSSDHFLLGERGTGSGGQTGQRAFPLGLVHQMRPRSPRAAAAREPGWPRGPGRVRRPQQLGRRPGPVEPPHKEMFAPGRRGLWAAARSLPPPSLPPRSPSPGRAGQGRAPAGGAARGQGRRSGRAARGRAGAGARGVGEVGGSGGERGRPCGPRGSPCLAGWAGSLLPPQRRPTTGTRATLGGGG